MNMHKKIKNHENRPFVIKNFLKKEEIKKIQDLYKDLPVEINNK